MRITPLLTAIGLCLAVGAPTQEKGQQASATQPHQPTPAADGYVLKHDQGERLFGGIIIIKASPKTGSRASMMATAAMGQNASTGLHYHSHTDEFFYVDKGRGAIVLGDQTIALAEGDSVFVPAGLDHKVVGPESGEPLEVVFFLETPEVAEEFRESHRVNNGGFSPSLEVLNSIANKHGTHYKSLK